MKLREIMTPNPIVLRPEQTVQDAAGLFLDSQVDGAAVINDNGQIIGIFSKIHIYQMVSRGLDMSTPVKEVMTREVRTARPDDKLEDAVDLELGRLPIVDDSGLVGMITRTDLLKMFFESYRNISSELDAILNSTYNLIVSVDEQGKIKFFNKSAEKSLGNKAEDVVGRNIIDVFPTSGLIDVMQTGKTEMLQKVKLNGRDYISNRTPIYANGKIAGAVAVLQDISELESISQELKYVKELNKELDAIIESSFDGLYITDGNGITLRFNKAFERITGIDGSEFMDRHVDNITKAGILSESVSALVLKRKEPATIIQKYKTGKTTLATGTPVFDKQGNIFRIVCNVRDITELNMLKQELEQARGLTQHYESELRSLRMQYTGADKLVVNSPKMRDLLGMVIRLAQVGSTILITGESGTGKELIAETIHNNSTRKDGPFIKVNCGAIPENLLESELFGYEYGAFTGARREGKPGYFELANGGTLFLDEIGDLPLNLQVKMLRVLQSKEIVRVGGGKPLQVDVRIVAATNRNLMEMVRKKEFREDLYYRLNVIPVNIPPLRDRKEEIPAMVLHFTQLFNRKYRLFKRIAPEVIDVFMRYDWPGNVRELENLIERLVVLTPQDVVTKDFLPANLIGVMRESSPEVLVSGIVPLRDAVEHVEKQILKKAYAEYRTTRQMAKVLKVDASTIVRKAAKYGIIQSRPDITS